METEVKVLGIDPHRVIASLRSLDAELLFDGVVRSVYFDRGSSLRDSGTVLRVRSLNDACSIDVKAPIADQAYKISEEYGFSGRFDDAIAALQALGFEEYARSEKQRTSYRLGAVRIDIDHLLDHLFVPTFLEIEGEPDAIEAAIELLRLGDHECVSWTGKGLIEHYRC
jgi:predicted adenylyl cyclase CyaB